MSGDGPSYPTTGIHPYVERHIASLGDLSGQVVVDIPAGDGRSSHACARQGATVWAFDLFPEFMKAPGVVAERADMGGRLPVEDASADLVVCQEGIEHISDQLGLLREFNRILKPGGRLLLTTPSLSHLRARLANFCFESDLWKRMPPTEVDSIWFSDGAEGDRLYFGHLFLVGVNRLLTLSRLAGFSLTKRVRTGIGMTSLLLLPLCWPVIALVSLLAYWRNRSRFPNVPAERRQAIFAEHLRVNCSALTLLCKFTFWELRKEDSVAATEAGLKALTTGEGRGK